MFTDMRAALAIPKSTDILHHIEALPADKRPSALQAIRDIEAKAMKSQKPQPGLAELMSYLDAHSVRKAICTRNFDVPVQHLLSTFIPSSTFHPIVTRDFKPPKPDPAGILHIAEAWGLVDESGKGKGEGLIMVGDSLDDMTAGRMAGAATVLLVNEVNKDLAEHAHTDLVVESLDELVGVLKEGFQGREIVVE